MGDSKPPRVVRGRAQTLTILVLALPAFIAAVGLAMDVGNLYFNYVKLQTAADASVLSGARYLPNQPCRAITTADTYANCFNGIHERELVSTTTSYGANCPAPASTPAPVTCPAQVPPAGCSMVTPPPSAEAGCNITMQARRIVNFYFARLVGVDQGTVGVTATATVAEAGAVLGAVPIGLQYTTPYSYGSGTVLLFRPNPTTTVPPNYWSALRLGAQFTTVFPAGYDTKLSLNDAIAADKSALTTGPVSAAIQSRIDLGYSEDPSGTAVPPPDYTANDGRAVTLILVDWGAAGGCCRVKGFAQFWVQSVSNGNITGYWIGNGINGSLDLSGTAPLDGALAIKLTQ
jgi:hypothetical protein